jgi:hypothetical protein
MQQSGMAGTVISACKTDGDGECDPDLTPQHEPRGTSGACQDRTA